MSDELSDFFALPAFKPDEALVKLVEPLLGNPDALATLPADRRHALLTLAAERTRRALSSAPPARRPTPSGRSS